MPPPLLSQLGPLYPPILQALNDHRLYPITHGHTMSAHEVKSFNLAAADL